MIEIMKTEKKLQKGRGGGGGAGRGGDAPFRKQKQQKKLHFVKESPFLYLGEPHISTRLWTRAVPYLLIEQDPLPHPAPPTQYQHMI